MPSTTPRQTLLVLVATLAGLLGLTGVEPAERDEAAGAHGAMAVARCVEYAARGVGELAHGVATLTRDASPRIDPARGDGPTATVPTARRVDPARGDGTTATAPTVPAAGQPLAVQSVDDPPRRAKATPTGPGGLVTEVFGRFWGASHPPPDRD